ncbi:hypothetical protein [Streptomyces sp. NPDC048737]
MARTGITDLPGRHPHCGGVLTAGQRAMDEGDVELAADGVVEQ